MNPISEGDPQYQRRRRAMSLTEFSERYGPSRTKTYEEIKCGRLRAIKCGKRTLITEDDAEAWLMSLPPVAPVGARA
jgi:excisionase family DNA binding protein